MEFIITIQEPEIQLITVASQGEQGIAGLIWIDAGWASGVDYVVDNALEHNGSSYRVFVAHTSAAATEPGVGVDWETVWKLLAEKGDTGSGGDMLKSVYDPTAVEDDAFDMDNMLEGATKKILNSDQQAAMVGANDPDADNVFETRNNSEDVIDATAGGTFAIDFQAERVFRVTVGTAAVTLNFTNKPTGDNARGPTVRLKFTGATIPTISWEDAGIPITFETWDEDISDATPLVGAAKIEVLYQDSIYDALKWGVV